MPWFTETDIGIAQDVELLDLMREAGCRQVLIGLESPDERGLDRLELRRNWKLRQLGRYESGVRLIQSRGITVNGCFILGLDGQTPEVFDGVREFARALGLWDVQITVNTAFPGTPHYAQLLAEGRILEPGAWHKCTLFDVNVAPTGMSPEALQAGLLSLAGSLYAPEEVRARRQAYFENLNREVRRRVAV